MIGLIIIIQNVIASSFNLIAGHIADQLSAKKISMIADIVQGAACLNQFAVDQHQIPVGGTIDDHDSH
ncbi:hypothetical protein S101258_02223 [Lactiplantibacillus plantarum subsp. plantarum]|uniref:Uncharacterized protein n=1 Tax=Lactiplantibacillus plantarum subsp. plantarum TaxID=337330 RepID=A0A2S3U422_LACPN|nr:hypothetical protein S101258_02223 [Lactiplantibacillus plantarum subsp. plantarum]